MKYIPVPDLMKTNVEEFMKERDVDLKTFLIEPEAYTKYIKLISVILIRGMQAVQEFEDFDKYNDEIAREAGE